MSNQQSNSGILLIDKPQGVTSHDVVAKARKALGTRRVGHAGTLDPMATGLLVLGINAGTKLLNYLVGAEKTYLASFRLGWATTTDDAEGERLIPDQPAKREISAVSDDEVIQAISSFSGDQLQIPSSVSAVRIDGKRAYDLVREGVAVELKPREISIHSFTLTSKINRNLELGTIEFQAEIACSSGTYIRAIARDLGSQLGLGGHLIGLRRTRVGAFEVDDVCELDSPELIGLAEAAAKVMPVQPVSDVEAAELRFGRKIRDASDCQAGDLVAAVSASGALIAVTQADESRLLQPRWVVTEEG